MNLNNIVQIHHIIPKEFKTHPTILLSNYNIEDGYNLIFLPTNIGKDILNIHNDRPLHYKGHLNYNKYIRKELDNIFITKNLTEKNMCNLNKKLRENMRHINIPWY